MRALTQADLLALWESGKALHPLDWALLAVNTISPETQLDNVADWPIGRRNRALAESPLLEQGAPIVVNGRTFRLPTSRDLARIAAEDDPGTAAVALVEMCR